MYKIFCECTSGNIILKDTDCLNFFPEKKHLLLNGNEYIKFEDMKNCVVTGEGQEIFKVRNGVVIKDYKEFMETLMIGSDIHGVKTEVNEVIKQYQEWCERLEMSQNNLKGLMKAVTKETNMIMSKSKNVEEAKKVIEECKEQLSK